MNAPFRARGLLLSRNYLLPAALALMALTSLVSLLIEGNHALAFLALGGFVLGVPASVLTLMRDALPRRRPTEITIDERGLAVGDAAPIPPEEIVEAKLVPRHGRDLTTVLELAVRKERPWRLRLWLADVEARAAMTRLGALPGSRRTSFALVVPFGRRFVVAFALLFPLVLLGVYPFVSGPFALDVVFSMLVVDTMTSTVLAAILALVAGIVRGRVFVGAEGFTTRFFGRERFRSFRDVTRIDRKYPFGGGSMFSTVVHFADGTKTKLSPVEAPVTASDIGTASRALESHVTEAFARYTALASGSADPDALLARGGRTPRAWLAAIDGVARGDGARYRVAPVDFDDLAPIARDPNATPEARTAASAALVRSGDPRHRTTVRIAAEACAEPELRGVLSDLADADAGDDARVASVLARAPH